MAYITQVIHKIPTQRQISGVFQARFCDFRFFGVQTLIFRKNSKIFSDYS